MTSHPIFHPLHDEREAARQGGFGSNPPLATPPVDSDTLFKGHRTLMISHNGGVYMLRATNAGNLKLTK
ncbi:MAG: hemin uptake protein HemP [Pseudorhodoferax sp.]